MTDADLIRFVNAQADVYNQVVQELSEGRKQSHWMWFIFPQVAGLGHSSMAHNYAIRDLNQANRYLADPLLGSRLREDVRLLMRHKGKSAFEILGSLDDLKFRSCLTLFAQAASDDTDRSLFTGGFGSVLWRQGGSSNTGAATLDLASKYLVLKPKEN